MISARIEARAWLVATVLLAGACARPPPEPPAGNAWLSRQQALTRLPAWSVAGRLAIIDGGQGWQGSVRWQQRAESYSVDLLGPLGQGRVFITGSDAGVRMQTSRGELSAADPEALLQQALATSASVPLNGLQYWLRGLPNPAQPSRPTIAGDGRLLRLEQAGWVVDYPNYVMVNGLLLPQRIQASHVEQQVSVKLFLNEWQI